MSAPLVSIVTPAYNASEYLHEALDSVLAQTLGDWELVVVDDGSTDRTAAIAEGYGDRRIRLIRQARQGVSAARNRAVRESRGALLAFLDADDRFLPTKLAVQTEFLRDHPTIGSVYCHHRRIDNAGEPWTLQAPPPEAGYRELLLGFPFNPSAQMVRREWHERSGGFPDGIALHEDRDYWLRLCAAGCRLANSPGVLADYRIGPPKPAADPVRNLQQALEVLDRGLARDEAESIPPDEQLQARFDIYRESALQAAATGQTPNAREWFHELPKLRRDLMTDHNRRDELLQAIVDFSVRTRGNPEPLLAAVWDALPGSLADLRRLGAWAAGCGALLGGVRERMWNNREATEERFRRAKALGARLDARASNLLCYDLRQYAAASPKGALRELLDRVEPDLAAVTSRLDAAAFRRLAEADPDASTWAARVARRLQNWRGTQWA